MAWTCALLFLVHKIIVCTLYTSFHTSVHKTVYIGHLRIEEIMIGHIVVSYVHVQLLHSHRQPMLVLLRTSENYDEGN